MAMFKSRLQTAIGKVDGFIAQIQAGIDDSRDEWHKKLSKRDELMKEADAIQDDIEVGQALLNNLTKLKG